MVSVVTMVVTAAIIVIVVILATLVNKAGSEQYELIIYIFYIAKSSHLQL